MTCGCRVRRFGPGLEDEQQHRFQEAVEKRPISACKSRTALCKSSTDLAKLRQCILGLAGRLAKVDSWLPQSGLRLATAFAFRVYGLELGAELRGAFDDTVPARNSARWRLRNWLASGERRIDARSTPRTVPAASREFASRCRERRRRSGLRAAASPAPPRETACFFPRLFGLNGGVEGEQVGAIRHLGDGGDHFVDVAGLFVDGLKGAIKALLDLTSSSMAWRIPWSRLTPPPAVSAASAAMRVTPAMVRARS